MHFARLPYCRADSDMQELMRLTPTPHVMTQAMPVFALQSGLHGGQSNNGLSPVHEPLQHWPSVAMPAWPRGRSIRAEEVG